jgi:BASS family bile acid:Na+ symporter
VERFLRDYTAIERLVQDVAGLLIIKNFALITFIVSTMLSIGLSVNLKQIKAIISNYKLMAKGLLANFLIVPVVAWILAQIIPMEESISTGFLLISVCAAAALGPKLAQKSRSDVPFAATMIFILSALTAFITPLWLSVFLSTSGDGANNDGFATPTINPLQILIGLIVLYLIPMLIGILINSRYPDRFKYRAQLEKVSNIFLLVVIALVVVTNLSGLVTLIGSLGIITSLVSIMIYGTLGYILGGPGVATKRSLAFDTGMRNEAAALAIATLSFSDQPNVAVVVVVFGMMQFVIMGVMAYYWSKKSKGPEDIKVSING